ncbi:MAG TPA: protein translocase subunit SecF [Anaerovoracaceae bacterium]|nr:protein translocase subunit SecF [Anaerovoracaceae bacterium]
MNLRLKRILAGLVVVVVLFGWYVTVFGIGSLTSIKDAMKFGLDINGGVYVVMEAQTDETGEELTKLMEQTRAVLDNRVNQMGIAESSVTIEGDNRLRIEMPGVQDAQEAINQIGRTAQLEFLLADGTVILDGSKVKTAGVDTDSEHGGYKIDLEFTAEGSSLFEEGTRTALSGSVESTIEGVSSGRCIAIALDGEIITAPEVQSVISGGQCEISSNSGYSKEEASNTAALIRGGALPVSLQEVTSSVQTATIGEDALAKSVVAGLIGLALVFVLMLIFYNVLGLVANVALLLYILLILWIMAGMGSVLTLPGIAGIILSVGMAVDANVIIFARIKEEIVDGKSIRVAVDQGFKHALGTVLDAQITTLIAAVVLYEIGTTTVKGFALTLIIGIVVSIFTAVVITQLFISLMAETKKFNKNKYFGVNEDGTPKRFVKKDFYFIKHRKIFYTISVAIIVVGIAFTFVRGFNYGIDFTGGTMLQLDMHQRIETTEVEKAIAKYDLDPTIIHAGENEEQIVIRTMESLENNERAEVVATLGEAFGVTEEDVLASEQFGPSVGKELKTNAVKAVLISAIGMLLYIIIRFKSWKYGVAAVGGVLHDVLFVLAFYVIFGVTVNNPFIAGILTVVGYSINDTIVIFDRIRENKKLFRKESNEVLMDLSLNQTLNRSIMTSLTTLIVMIPLFLMVSTSIREFVVPLMVGIIVGAYSSIFVCSPVLYEFYKGDDTSKYLAKTQPKALEGKSGSDNTKEESPEKAEVKAKTKTKKKSKKKK